MSNIFSTRSCGPTFASHCQGRNLCNSCELMLARSCNVPREQRVAPVFSGMSPPEVLVGHPECVPAQWPRKKSDQRRMSNASRAAADVLHSDQRFFFLTDTVQFSKHLDEFVRNRLWQFSPTQMSERCYGDKDETSEV